ncbi:MAG: carboxypeptidase-like regulatory domain-containing protein [Gemmatimonadaceae bacterium]
MPGGKRLHLVAAAAIVTLIAAYPACAGAQQQAELRVLVQAKPGAPLPGALVALVDPADNAVTESLSGSSGHVALKAAPGQYRVRVRRIGYRPFYTDPVAIPRAGEFVVNVESARVVLQAMVVSASTQCGRMGNDEATLSSAWEEISKALRSTQLTAEDVSAIGQSIKYRRELSRDGSTVSADSTFLMSGRNRPFAAIDPASLARDGFVRGNTQYGWDFYGPDERVLLSSSFAETHCFKIVRERKRAGQVGVAFEPVPRRRAPDIKGALWIDEETSELREITFQYVNADPVDRFDAGGFTRFRRMPSGAWIVSEWRLRMPRLRMDRRTSQTDVIGYIENGGRVVEAKRPGS